MKESKMGYRGSDRDYGGDRWRDRDERGFYGRDYGRDYGRSYGRGGDERGFFERAGDEVRSWFGDEEAERRRERDTRREEQEAGFVGRGFDRSVGSGSGASVGSRSRYGFGGSDLGGGYGQRSFGGGSSGPGGIRSQWDDNYRQWRDRQIQQFDSEYEDYCRERQQQFEQDFDS